MDVTGSRLGVERLDAAFGGPARRRVVLVLAMVLGLDAADKATVGAVAAELQQDLGVSNLGLGVVAAASLAVAGVATLPVGLLVDRVSRTRLLAGSIVLWAGAMVATGAAVSLPMLVLSRLALGAVSATAGPSVASLVGDYFPPKERGRMYGFVLTGEIVGAGAGFVASGLIAAALSWRWGFWAMVVPALATVWVVLRRLPEPARGGASRIPEGADAIPATGEPGAAESQAAGADGADAQLTAAQSAAVSEDVDPAPERVLHQDPADMGLPAAIRYVLRVPTNRVMILISSLGWFFFATVRTFGVIFVRGHFGLGQTAGIAVLAIVGAGGLLGVLIGGRLSDALIERGRINGRVIVAFIAYGLTPLLLAPGIAFQALAISLPLLFAGTVALGAANPPVDAGRLDVMHHRLWGRAEGVRTLVRTWAEAAAPLVFGWLSQQLGGRAGSPFALEGAARGSPAAEHATTGLRNAFLVMLAPVAIGALIGLRTLRTYPTDVATAARSEQETGETDDA